MNNHGPVTAAPVARLRRETGAASAEYAAVTAAGCGFAGVLIAGQVASHLLRTTAEALNLGQVDKIAGGAFGFLKGVLICQVILIAACWVFVSMKDAGVPLDPELAARQREQEEEEREALKRELRAELEQERRPGFWGRLFGRR